MSWQVRLREVRPIANEVYVTIHGSHVEPSPRFPARIASYRWNGWVVPRFRREVAELVMEWVTEWNELSSHPAEQDRLTWNGDTIWHNRVDGEDVESTRVVSDRDGYYPIGANSWTWSEVT